jgi:hypothetical protein
LLAAPHFAQKFRFRYNTLAVLDEELKRCQGLGGESDSLLVLSQGSQLAVEPKSAEANDRVVVRLVSRQHTLFRNFQDYPENFQRLLSLFSARLRVKRPNFGNAVPGSQNHKPPFCQIPVCQTKGEIYAPPYEPVYDLRVRAGSGVRAGLGWPANLAPHLGRPRRGHWAEHRLRQ